MILEAYVSNCNLIDNDDGSKKKHKDPKGQMRS
jgi:hypothetical protein